ncbi:MAG: hypothetical protein K0Q54_4997, partial [Methylobacterium brachiatum]|nr:hypothetical protein [Methylobacterium brachiatum]
MAKPYFDVHDFRLTDAEAELAEFRLL